MPTTRDLIAEALLEGLGDQAIKERLVAAGANEERADCELRHAASDPYFQAARKLANRVAKRDWTLDIYARSAALDDMSATIPTIDAIDPEAFFRDYYTRNRPVKLTGLVDHWPALVKWSLDYLEGRVGSAIVEVQGQRDNAADYEIDKDKHRRHAPMRDVIALLRRDQPSNDFYITAYNDSMNKQALAPLWADLGPISLLEKTGPRDGFFWMGPQGTLTPFHHDLTNNLLVQVRGRKQVRMVPSYAVGRMRNTVHCFSEVQPKDFAQGGSNMPQMLECEIAAGEAIFLPVGWWHHVTALDQTISMSFTNFSQANQFTDNYPADANF